MATVLGVELPIDDSVRFKVPTYNEILLLLAAASSNSAPRGRLTLVTATPVMTTTQSAKTSIFYTPHTGNVVPIWNGTVLVGTIFTELTLALDSNAAHTGYHQSGKNFDLFVVNDVGTIRLVSGPAWTSDIARATALEYKNGVLCNAASMTARFDASVSTLTVAQDKGTYVGTFRASANGQTEYIFGALGAGGTAASFLLWNAYNRVSVGTIIQDSTNSWTLAASSIRAANASNTMRASFIQGLQEEEVSARYNCNALAGASGNAAIGVGLDSVTAFSGSITPAGLSTQSLYCAGEHVATLLGFHYFQAMEAAQTAGTATFYGDAGVPTWIQNGMSFRGRF